MGKRNRRRNRVRWFNHHQKPQTTTKTKEIGNTGVKSTEKVTEVAKNDASKALPPCHDGVQCVFNVGAVQVWGGKAQDIMLYDDWDLMILCTDKHGSWEDNEPPTPVVQTAAAKKVWGDFSVQPVPYIGICWEDYGLPDVPDGWWERLATKIREFGAEKVKMNVAIGCTGGHGRTGTSLAILYGLLSGSTDCPVTAIRGAYCSKTVESRSQINYIEEVTGIKCNALPAWCQSVTSMRGYYTGLNSEGGPSSGLAQDGGVYEEWKKRYDAYDGYVYEKTCNPFTGEWEWTKVVKNKPKVETVEPLPNETGQGKDQLPHWSAVGE